MVPIRRVLGGVAVAAVALGALVVPAAQAAPAVAAASTKAVPGPGLSLRAARHHTVGRTLHAGSWLYGGRTMYCVSYNLLVPDGPVAAGSATAVMPGAEATARAQFLVNAYGDTKSAHQAAQVWFALATLIAANPGGQPSAAGRAQAANLKADLPSYLAQLSTADRTGITQMLTASLAHGPYRVAVAVKAVQVGQTTVGTVTVLAANGRPAPGRPVAVTATGAAITRAAGATGSTGRSSFTFQRTGAGSVGFRAVATAPSSARVVLNKPSGGRQVVLGGGYTETAAGTAGFRLSPATPLTTWACSENCDGLSTVTFSATNPAGAASIRWTYTDAATGRVLGRHIVQGGATGRLVVSNVPDATQVRRSFCYVSTRGVCSTPESVVAGMVEVVCPAWAAVTVTKSCSCKPGKAASFAFTVPASTRYYRVTVTRNGDVTTADLTGGQAKTLTVPLAAGDDVAAGFVAYRDAARTIELASGVLDGFAQR